MGLKISDTASSPNYIAFGGSADTAPFNMQAEGSFCLMIKNNATPDNFNRILCKNVSGAGTRSWGVRYGNSSINLNWYQPGPVTDASTDSRSNGVWYQLVGTFDPAAAAGSLFRLYVNGSVQETESNDPVGTSVTSAPQTNTVAFSIGKDQQTGNNGAPIDVAEFQWTDTAITSAQALAMYNGGLFKRFADIGVDPTNYWPMLGDETTTITDTVGSQDGTGSGVTNANAHPDMFYLDTGGGFRTRGRNRFRGR